MKGIRKIQGILVDLVARQTRQIINVSGHILVRNNQSVADKECN